MPYRIVFCGTPEFAVPSLCALFDDPDFQIEKVYSQPDRPSGRGKKLKASSVKQIALDKGLAVETPAKISAPEMIQDIQAAHYDLAVVVAYGQILSQSFLDSFRFGCVNIHSSLLPRWRGAAPMQRAIMAGDKETGVSLQKIVKKLDAGDVIAEKRIPLPLDMGATQLYNQLSELGSSLLVKDLKEFLMGTRKAWAQEESQVTHAAKILKDEAFIDWSRSAFEIHNKIRGLDMGGPFATTLYQGKNLKLHKSCYVELSTQTPAGEIVDVTKESFKVACGENQLEILSVQPESKARMSAADFIRGYSIQKGQSFGK